MHLPHDTRLKLPAPPFLHSTYPAILPVPRLHLTFLSPALSLLALPNFLNPSPRIYLPNAESAQ